MPEIHGYQRLFAELKRRRVFRVMAVYGVVGFVLLQVVDLAVPALLLPEWTYRLVALILLIGFPVAVVLAWAFDVTPAGVKKSEDAAPGEIEEIVRAPRSARWPAGLAALVGVVALVWGAWYVGKQAGRSIADVDREGASGPEAAWTGSGMPGVVALASATDDDRRTLAVLPFDNMAGDPATEPFVVGVHDDLLTQLSKIRALRVTSRTSVKEYRDTDKSIPEIAGELGVETILEGGVQRSGSQVRINVQLIDPATDEHLWAETYDAELTAENVFQIQSRIARSVAEALEAELSPSEQATLDVIGTRDLEALAAYHVGRNAWYDRSGRSTNSTAIASFERAVEIDPDFAEAWAGLAMILSWEAQTSPDPDIERIEEAIAQAETLAPDSPETELARGYYAYYARRDFARALQHFRTADRIRPSDSGTALAIAYILRRQGDWSGAQRELLQALDIDPRNGRLYDALSETLGKMRRWRAAEAFAERGLAVDPGNPQLMGRKIYNLVRIDRGTRRARRYADGLPAAVLSDNVVRLALTYLTWEEGRPEEALQVSTSVPPGDALERMAQTLWVARIEAALGHVENSRRAAERLERDLSEHLRELDGFRTALIANARALQGDTAGVVDLADRAISRAAASDDAMTGPTVRQTAATALAWVGDYGRAAETMLELAALMTADPSVADLLLDPDYEGFRQSPEFPAVLAAFEAAEAEAARLDAEEGY